MTPNTDPGDVTFRRAVRDDLATLVALLADDDLGRRREDPTLPLRAEYLGAFDAIDSDPNQLLLVASTAAQVLGVLQVTFIPGLSRLGTWRAQIEAVRISREARGSGLGRGMIEHAIAEARCRGCGLVQLTSDKTRTAAHRFYEGLGFRPTHEGFKLDLSPRRDASDA